MPDGYLKTNDIYCGDCKKVLAQFPEESVDLIYVDPPFFSNRQYEVLWGDGYELRTFEDRWKGGIENYIAWMEDKLRECHRVLKDTGSMYLHCDWHSNAHLRILMDRIFGEKNFRNEIIWHYQTYQGQVKRYFPKKHDTIFLYSKGDNWKFNQLYDTNYEDTINYQRWKKWIVDGKIYARYYPKQDSRFMAYYNRWVKEHGRKPKNDEIIFEATGNIIDSVWDIKAVDPKSKERLGYPTQKSEVLLERIINASSNPTDIVLDPMCGCGTTLVAAHKLGRQWIGIDVSPTACRLMANRMRSLGVSIGDNDIIGLPRTLEEVKAMQPFEFQNWVCEKLLARVPRRMVGDFGIDGWLIDGRPLQVKQSENIGRNVVDNFETAIRRESKDKGIIVAFSFGKGAYEEVARAKLHDGLDIELKAVEKVLREE